MQAVNEYGSLQFLTNPDNIVKETVTTFKAVKARFIPSGNGLLHYQTFTIDQTAHQLAGLVFTQRFGEIVNLQDYTHDCIVDWQDTAEQPHATMLTRDTHRFIRCVDRHVASVTLLGKSEQSALKIDKLILQDGLRSNSCDCSDHVDPRHMRYHPESDGFPENSEWPQKFRLQQVDLFVAVNSKTQKTHLLVLQPNADLIPGQMGTFTITSYSEAIKV